MSSPSPTTRLDTELSLLQAMYPTTLTFTPSTREIHYISPTTTTNTAAPAPPDAAASSSSSAAATLTLRLPNTYPDSGLPQLISAHDARKSDLRDDMGRVMTELALVEGEEVLDQIVMAFEDLLVMEVVMEKEGGGRTKTVGDGDGDGVRAERGRKGAVWEGRGGAGAGTSTGVDTTGEGIGDDDSPRDSGVDGGTDENVDHTTKKLDMPSTSSLSSRTQHKPTTTSTLTHKPPPPPSPPPNKTTIIWLHHLLATSKRKLAVSPPTSSSSASASSSSSFSANQQSQSQPQPVTGLVKPGYPGILIYHGAAPLVDAHVRELKALRWQGWQVRYDSAEEDEASALASASTSSAAGAVVTLGANTKARSGTGALLTGDRRKGMGERGLGWRFAHGVGKVVEVQSMSELVDGVVGEECRAVLVTALGLR